MKIRLLIGAPDRESLALYRAVLCSALDLLPLDVVVQEATARSEVADRVAAGEVDVLFLDWSLAGADTPACVRELVATDRRLRSIVVLPLHVRQYRTCLWEAGACVGLPKEHLDQEWLLSVLCLVTRAMEREERARHEGLA